MEDPSIKLYLNGHCIETESRNMRDEITGKLLDGEEDQLLVKQFELLDRFIAETDFASLRASDPYYTGEEPCMVTVHEADGRIEAELEPPTV